MVHFYEKNIVEIKNEYTRFLTDIITPLLFEGFRSIYNDSLKIEEKLLEKSRTDPTIKPQNVLKIFQTCLREVPKYNRSIIETETERIKNASRCYEWFDDLVRAVVKSNIILLTYSSYEQNSELLEQRYYDTINTVDFIHKCYIEAASFFYNNPKLFQSGMDDSIHRGLTTAEIKLNQTIIVDKLGTAIGSAIRKLLPMKLILDEFLKKDYRESPFRHVPDQKYIEMKNTVHNDLYNNDTEDNNSNNDGYNSDEEISENDINDIQDKITRLNDAIKINMNGGEGQNSENEVDRSESEYSDSNSRNSSDIADVVNNSIKNITNMINEPPAVKSKKLSMKDILGTKNSSKIPLSSNNAPNENNQTDNQKEVDNVFQSKADSEQTNFFANYLSD